MIRVKVFLDRVGPGENIECIHTHDGCTTVVSLEVMGGILAVSNGNVQEAYMWTEFASKDAVGPSEDYIEIPP